MTEIAVRCETCGMLARVPAMAVGKFAVCPSCQREFTIRAPAALSVQPVIPVVYPSADRSEPSDGLLYGLALSAFLVPLVWLLLKTLGNQPPVFTLGLPLSIAIAAAGLGIGIAWARDWSFGQRLKGILILLGLGWGLAATFYYLKSEWVEEIRRDLGLPISHWEEFRAPSKAYRIHMPGRPRPERVELIRGWALEIHRFADREDKSFAFCSGDGRPDAAAVGQTDEQFFAAARQGALDASNGTLVDDKPVTQQGQPGREFTLKLADQATNRTMRVFRVGTRAVVVMVEGPFLPPDAREVRKFFESLYLVLGR